MRTVNAIALAIARHRMGDIGGLLTPDQIVQDSDLALALQLVRMAQPLFPLPAQPYLRFT